MSILLFVPAYNCETQIARVIAQLTPDVCQLFDGLIIVNNRSTDNTEAAAAAAIQNLPASFDAKVLCNNENFGLGGSHKVAFSWARMHGYDYVVVLHGDDQGDIADITPLIKSGIHEQYDCLLGARFHADSTLHGYSRLRTFGNHVFNLLFSIAAGRRVYDLGSGLNLYRTAILSNNYYAKCPDDLTFNYSMILASCVLKHRFRFFPMKWREDDQVSNVRLVSQASVILFRLFRFICSRHRFLREEQRAVSRPLDAYRAEVVASRCPVDGRNRLGTGAC